MSFSIEGGKIGAVASLMQHKGSSVNKQRQEGPHAHSIYAGPDNKFAYAPDLGIDQVKALGQGGVAGALAFASTGIVGASVITLGLLSLPVMLKNNYPKSLSCGVICASGTLGQIIPPSLVLILLADVTSSAYQQAQLNMGIYCYH